MKTLLKQKLIPIAAMSLVVASANALALQVVSDSAKTEVIAFITPELKINNLDSLIELTPQNSGSLYAETTFGILRNGPIHRRMKYAVRVEGPTGSQPGQFYMNRRNGDDQMAMTVTFSGQTDSDYLDPVEISNNKQESGFTTKAQLDSPNSNASLQFHVEANEAFYAMPGAYSAPLTVFVMAE